MKKLITLLSIVFFMMFFMTHRSAAQDRIMAARKAYIKEQVKITPEQEEKFWPVYQEYVKKRRSIFMQLRALRNEANNTMATEEEMKATIQKFFVTRQQMLDLDKEYFNGKFLTILSAKQVVQLAKAEKEFLKKVLKKLTEEE